MYAPGIPVTPGARVAAAIGVLDTILGGAPAEKTLTNWARQNRYAGARDRAALRDHVFDALRCRRSFAALGGGDTGRGLMLGALRAAGRDPAGIFTGDGHAPAPLAADERAYRPGPMQPAVALDCPDWLEPPLRDALGADFAPVMSLLQARAPLFLRVNLRKADQTAAIDALAGDGIVARPHPLSPTALEVTENPRRVWNAAAYRDGLVEIQDAGSQALCDAVPVPDAARVLDYCAGGGGKSLALAARAHARFFAHDVAPRRLADLTPRAARAGVGITCLGRAEIPAAAPFDLVLADVPCSGSGAWRRQPGAKWDLTAARLAALTATQDRILCEAAPLVAPDGMLAYATCSLLGCENRARIETFQDHHPDWKLLNDRVFTPLEGGDGFYLALLTRQ